MEITTIGLDLARHWRWHLDEMIVRVNGEHRYLWRAVDHEGEVLKSYVTKLRNPRAAVPFTRKALKRHGTPVGQCRQAGGRPLGQQSRGEHPSAFSTTRARDAEMPTTEDPAEVAFVHADVHNHFNAERHLVDRPTFKQRRAAALAEW